MRHADELQVSTEDYSLWGGSAGARMAAYLGSYSTQGFIHATHERPAAVIMGYTGHSEYTQNDPPTYVIIGEDDAIASPATMRRRVENLQALGIDAEFHLLPGLRHGFGLGIGTTAEGWERMPSGFGRDTFPVKIEILTENIVKGRNRLRSTFAMLFVEQ